MLLNSKGFSRHQLETLQSEISIRLNITLHTSWERGRVNPIFSTISRMRYSRHKRSGISYGCHNESLRTTFSCHKRSCLATSYPLSRIYCRCRMYRRFGVSVSADDCSLLPPPNGSSMAMQVNARTHLRTIFPHTLDLLWQ